MTFQTNIKLYLFRKEFSVKKRIFHERYALNFFPRNGGGGERVNSSIPDTVQPRRNLDNLTSLYDLAIFNLNTELDVNLSTDCNLPNQPIQSSYFSPHSFNMFKKNLPKGKVDSSFSVFHNSIASISRNLENVSILLYELDFHFNVIGITETKFQMRITFIQAFQVMFLNTYQHVWPLEAYDCLLINHCIIRFLKRPLFKPFVNENIVCGIIYRHHNSPEYFQSYFEEVIEKMVSDDKTVYIMGDFNIDLLKCETS